MERRVRKDELRAMGYDGSRYLVRLIKDDIPDMDIKAVACVWDPERQEISDPRLV